MARTVGDSNLAQVLVLVRKKNARFGVIGMLANQGATSLGSSKAVLTPLAQSPAHRGMVNVQEFLSNDW